MTLNKTWKECLRMWKWIVKQTSNRRQDGVNEDVVKELKKEWLVNHGYDSRRLQNDCFFCDYAVMYGYPFPVCSNCPGYKVSKFFHCTRPTYYWQKYPHRFYKKLLQLDAKRRKK